MEITQKQKEGLEKYLKKISNGEFLDVKIKIRKRDSVEHTSVYVYVKLNKPNTNQFYDHYLSHIYDDKIRTFF